jgi:phage tail sheath protein FI
MALFTPSASPAVTVKEIDLTGVVPNVQTSTGAFVGDFGWGPADERTLISDEAGLVRVHSAPTTSNTVDFHSAAYFLRYSNSLYVTRVVDTNAKNAYAENDGLPSTQVATQYKNLDAYQTATFTADTVADSDNTGSPFIAKYPGVLGNSIRVSVSDNSTHFNTWTYKGSFDRAPGTSQHIKDVIGSDSDYSDEIHIAVIDRDGKISGTPNTVLETFPHVSVATNAKGVDGSSIYYRNVLERQSSYVFGTGAWRYAVGDSDGASSATSDINGLKWDTAATNGQTASFASHNVGKKQWDFDGGANSTSIGTSDIASGYDLYEDKDNIQIDFLIAPESTDKATATTVVNDLIAIAEARKDCVAVASPDRAACVTTPTAAEVTSTTDTYTKSTYAVIDNNYLKVFDKYNDQYIKIPAASSTAGVMAATDLVAAPWFSPAGSRRGNYLGVTDITFQPTKTDRDTLYKAGVNPIANIPGEGIILFGDKTNASRPTAFDRINVRRLFLAIERAIETAAKNVMFEFNDEFTRAEFVNVVEPFLREVQGRRGITDFRVVCDETNNPAAIVDANEFVASIFVKPARSVNYVTLNFVAVRTGVDFEEVTGTV